MYGELREQFGLSAQLAVRAIAKACEAYKRDKTIQPVFRPLGAVPFDQRILSWKGRDRVSILTLIGRIEVPVLNQGRWRTQPGTTVRGQADLIHRDGKFYLAVVIDVPDPGDLTEPPEWLGVDLGVVNIATDSDGTTRSGKALRGLRRQNLRLRRRLQATGTKSAKRLLRKRRRREARFARDVNHCISKALVGRAKDTGRGIAPEGLQGIRDRVSRACSVCGHVDKRNRPTRDDFRCVSCGHAAPADHNAAINIGRRAVVMQPNAA
ncbi:zinc ribbon domain-containing protein [Pseudonocardia asaccharolytica]|uniref:zinc ribbon domain-containing protein n=1 Tax=Pseudonocardia asaccharolytica TaxID=54010 RepID=UPI001B7FA488|nr:zinc ribbon domain-containing protein [Pseudonocardia asaccharolytica]